MPASLIDELKDMQQENSLEAQVAGLKALLCEVVAQYGFDTVLDGKQCKAFDLKQRPTGATPYDNLEVQFITWTGDVRLFYREEDVPPALENSIQGSTESAGSGGTT